MPEVSTLDQYVIVMLISKIQKEPTKYEAYLKETGEGEYERGYKAVSSEPRNNILDAILDVYIASRRGRKPVVLLPLESKFVE